MIRLLAFVPVIYGFLWFSEASPDLRDYLYPWLETLRAPSPFSEPVGNYSPPYLYLLWLAGKLGLPALHTIKLVSVLGTFCLAFAVRRLAGNEAAVVTLILPTTALNGPFLGQCDAYWVACCVLSVSMALERRTYAMAAWAGAAFAFKAQAAFLAPFCLLVLLRERKWPAALLPPAVYLAAITPAWLAGWPLADLLTVYFRQVEYPGFGNAPNLWALASTLINWRDPPEALLIVGYATGLAGVAAYLWKRPDPTLAAALLSAILLPFLLPKMHERFFFLADILALCLAFKDRRFVPVCIAVQAGSLLAYFDYMTGFTPLRIIGSACLGYALWRTWPRGDRLAGGGAIRYPELMSDDVDRYRRGVGVMLLNREGKVFVGARIDNSDEAWQMPQGGIDEGEDPWATALRELEEETGIPPHLVERVAECPERLKYDLPEEIRGRLWGGKWIGQDQDWYLARFTGGDGDVNIATEKPEFRDWKWIEPRQLPELIVPFKRDLYRRLLREFAPYL